MNHMKKMASAVLIFTLLSIGTAYSEDEAEPTFAVNRYVFSGNTLLDPGEIERTLQGYVGQQVSFQTIQQAVAALELTYVSHGFGAVKVVLPEQDIENGIVTLQIVEGRLGDILIDGPKYFSHENIRRSLPGLVEGGRPNMHRIDASLRVANENPAKQTGLVFRQGSEPGVVDAHVRVGDDQPLRVTLMADNTGAPDQSGKYQTGRFRTGVFVQHSNLLDRDHAMSFQYMTSPDHLRDVTILGLGYRIPLYATGDVLDFSFGYSNVNSGTISTAAGPIGISGSGQTYSMKYEQYLVRWGEWQQKLIYGLDYRQFSNSVKAEGSSESLIPDSIIHPFTLGYAVNLRLDTLELSANLSWVKNIPGGSDGRTEDFTKPGGRSAATADYQLWRFSASAMMPLANDWQFKWALSGQTTNHALISGELFGVGGAESVRGFNEREVSNDWGIRSGVEIHTPDLAARLKLDDMRLKALMFYDFGHVGRNHALPGEQTRETLSSLGVGVRATLGKNLLVRMDCGVVTDAGGNRQVGDKRLHASVVGLF